MTSSPLANIRLALRRWAVRLDVGVGLLAVTGLTALAAWELSAILSGGGAATAETRGLASALIAAWVAVVLACLGGAVKITSTRQGLVTLFTSEIKAIQFGLARMQMFEFWHLLHVHPQLGALGFADVPREENYFALFHSVIGNVANLQPRVVEAIVRFYTYLKMSRDAAGSLASWAQQTNLDVRRHHVSYVVYLLALSMIWGHVALWHMGQAARKADREFWLQIHAVATAVLGLGEFSKMIEEHPERAALLDFFGGELPVAEPDTAPRLIAKK